MNFNTLSKPYSAILALVIVFGSAGSHIDAQGIALPEKSISAKLDEGDLKIIEEIRADRQKLFDEVLSENKSRISELREMVRRQRSGKELVVPTWFSLSVMGRLPDNPQLGIKHFEQEATHLRREAARLKGLTPLEFVVDLIEAYSELNNLTSKIDQDARLVMLGRVQFDVLADFALPLETRYRYTRPDGSQFVQDESNIENWMVRNMMEAAFAAAEQQAEANRIAVEKHGNLIRADLQRLSPNCLRAGKAAFVEKRIELGRKREEERGRIAVQWRDGMISNLQAQITQSKANEKFETNALRRSGARREALLERTEAYRNERELLVNRISDLRNLFGEELLSAKDAVDERQRELIQSQVREANARQKAENRRLQMARDRFGDVELMPCPHCGPTSGICSDCGGSRYVPVR